MDLVGHALELDLLCNGFDCAACDRVFRIWLKQSSFIILLLFAGIQNLTSGGTAYRGPFCKVVLSNFHVATAWTRLGLRKEQERVRRRCRSYRFADGVLIRTMTDGEDKVVPAPAQRPNLVKEVHDFTGHWGEKRTVHLLKKTY
jgi:hypothetical protein